MKDDPIDPPAAAPLCGLVMLTATAARACGLPRDHAGSCAPVIATTAARACRLPRGHAGLCEPVAVQLADISLGMLR